MKSPRPASGTVSVRLTVDSITIKSDPELKIAAALDWSDLSSLYASAFEGITPRLVDRRDKHYAPAIAVLDALQRHCPRRAGNRLRSTVGTDREVAIESPSGRRLERVRIGRRTGAGWQGFSPTESPPGSGPCRHRNRCGRSTRHRRRNTGRWRHCTSTSWAGWIDARSCCPRNRSSR